MSRLPVVCFLLLLLGQKEVSSQSRANVGSSGTSGGGGPAVSTADIRALSRDLHTLEPGTGSGSVALNLQGKTTSTATNDAAPQSLLRSSSTPATGSTTALMKAIQDNYIVRVTTVEQITPAEKTEERLFLDAVATTPIMLKTEKFLKDRGLIPNTANSLRSKLQEMWFTPYSRSRGKISSSGFEHVFVGEIKNSDVSGFHNWVNFLKEEVEGDIDYKGYMKKIDLQGKGSVVKLRFTWEGAKKKVGSMFVGTTPEYEMALYTLCFMTRPGKKCAVQAGNGGPRFSIQTYVFNLQGKKLIGSAYPDI